MTDVMVGMRRPTLVNDAASGDPGAMVSTSAPFTDAHGGADARLAAALPAAVMSSADDRAAPALTGGPALPGGPVLPAGPRRTAPAAPAHGPRAVWTSVRSAYTDIFVDDWGPRRWMRARIFSLLFLLFLIGPIRSVVASDWSLTHQVLAIAGLGAFAACFAAVMWRNTPELHHNRTPLTVGLAVVFGVGLVAGGVDWLTGLSIYTIVMLLFNCGRRAWLPIVGGVPTAAVIVDVVIVGESFRDAVELAIPILLIGAVQAAFYQQIRAKVELTRARTDLARLAVSEERLRIARDLHDILGQRLSAVSLKAELAARLVERDPARAAAEMGEVAAVAREALSDVRETVSGYRALTLATEIETARALLTAAGVSVEVACAGEPLPESLDECAGALVREAVTNVIRHAAAGRCAIRIGRESGAVVVEVRDTGTGTSGPIAVGVTYGNGLTGLAERVERIGGMLWIGRDCGQFVVRATMPAGAVA
jgi:two-component system, NarL family, sensor histidine kinase DesK